MSKKIKSGDYCKCKNCGYKGYVYGVPSTVGVSYPYCPVCQRNDKLINISKEE